MSPRYCVTARNRLTGEREVVTPACSKENANDICLKLTLTPAKKRDYTHPKVELYVQQKDLFNPNAK